MKISFSITSFAIASLFIWVSCAQANGNMHEDCPMMKNMSQGAQADMESHTSPGAQKTSTHNAPDHSGHELAEADKPKSLDSALKAAMKSGDTCQLWGARNICPLMGKALLLHGPCCATQCSPAPLKSTDPSTAQSTASPGRETGMNTVYPALMAVGARPANLPAYFRLNEGPEPRPPTC